MSDTVTDRVTEIAAGALREMGYHAWCEYSIGTGRILRVDAKREPPAWMALKALALGWIGVGEPDHRMVCAHHTALNAMGEQVCSKRSATELATAPQERCHAL